MAARVKGYCTYRAIFTLFRCTTDELFFSCCDGVAAHFKHAATRQPRRNPAVKTCVDNTANLRPHALVLALRAAGANQLLKPVWTTPRSYGRRHRSWHHGHVHATHNERRRGQRLYTTIKCMRGAAGIGLGTTIKHLRRTASGTAGNGLGATMKYLRRTERAPPRTMA